MQFLWMAHLPFFPQILVKVCKNGDASRTWAGLAKVAPASLHFLEASYPPVIFSDLWPSQLVGLDLEQAVRRSCLHFFFP